MLTHMRGFSNGIVAKLLMLLLIVSFGIWGIGDIVHGVSTKGYAAKVAGETISIAEFGRQRAAIARQLEAAGNLKLDARMLNAAVLQQLVQSKLVRLSMKDMGLYVNDALLTQTLRMESAFRKPDGTFDAAAFRAMLKAQQLSEKEALSQFKDEISGKFLLASMDMQDVTPPAPVRQLMRTTELETRDAWIVNVPAAAAPSEVDEAALKEFYESNKSVLFMRPESRTLEYVALKPSQIDALVDASITEQMLADAAKKQPKLSPQEVKSALRNIQRDRALHDLQGAIDDALAGGLNLAEALKKAGIDTAPHTLTNALATLAKTSTDDVTKTVAEQGFQMAEGETSGLILSKNGTPVIVRVAAVNAAEAEPYDAVAADVRQRVVEQLRRDATKARVVEVKTALNQLAGSEPKQWQSVLDRFNLTALRVTGLKRPSEGKPMENGIPSALREAAFEHQVGGVAGPLSLETGGQMLAIITSINHPALPKEDEKITPASAEEFKKLSTALSQSVEARAFAAAAERYGVKVNTQLLSADAQAGE